MVALLPGLKNIFLGLLLEGVPAEPVMPQVQV